MSDGQVEIDGKVFAKRLTKLYNSWRGRGDASSGWSNVDAVSILVGKTDNTSYVKSQAMQLWLLGYEFSETIFVFTASKVFVLTSAKKAVYLKPLQSLDSLPAPLEIIERQKSESQTDKVNVLVASVKAAVKDIKSIGTLPKETFKDTLQTDFHNAIQSSGINGVDVSDGIANVLAVKDEEELVAVKHAGEIATDILSNLIISRLEEVIEESQEVSHSKLTSDFVEILGDGVKKNLKTKAKLSESVSLDHLETAYDPIIQSGGKYNLKYSAESNSDTLKFDTIILSLGLRYRNYCANVIRTIFIDPTKQQEEAYKAVLELRTHLSKLMVEGTKLCDIYAASKTFLEQKSPALKNSLAKEIGFSTGLEFREKPYVIDEKCQQKLRLGMVLCLNLGLSDLKTTKHGSEHNYAIQLADTIMITAEGAKSLTAKHNAKISNVSYNLDGEDESSGKTGGESSASGASASNSGTKRSSEAADVEETSTRKSRRTTKTDANDEAERVLRQQQLMKDRVAEGVKRFSSGADGAEEVKARKLTVDDKRDAITIPVNGLPVTFHVATIKQMRRIETEKQPVLQITFCKPHEALAVPNTDADDTVYIRQISLKCTESKLLQELQQKYTSMRKGFIEREKNEKEQASVSVQGALEVIRGSFDRLRDVLVRPAVVETKRTIGDVELHHNGIRYLSASNKKVDILFSNIKHLIYQPSENEFITVLHVHLKNAIMVGNKKITDIQFYREVASALADDHGRGGVDIYDKDELEKEQRERDERRRHEKDFKEFGKKIVDKAFKESKITLELDRPIRADKGEENPAFNGTPYRSTVLMRPTIHTLVQLVELPWTVVSLDDVEIAVCERVQPGVTRSFDVVFLNKNLKDFTAVNSIKIEELSKVQKWLTDCDIPYIENLKNTNWSEVLKEINKDPAGFYEDGGWKHVQEDQSDEEESDEDEEEEEDDDKMDVDGKDKPAAAAKGSKKKSKKEDSDSDSDFYDSEEEEDDDEDSDDDFDEDGDASNEDDDAGENEDELSDIAQTDEEDEDEEEEEDRGKKRKGGK